MKPTKESFDEEEEAFLTDVHLEHALPQADRERNSRWRLVHYLRVLVEVGMAVAIVFLLVAQSQKCTVGTLRRSPVPQFPRKIYTFNSNSNYTREDMFLSENITLHTLHNWIPLSSDSRGYVVIKQAEKYDLPEPYTIAVDRHNDGPGYMMTVFHQLHCLSYIAEHYQQGYGGVELTDEVAHHTAHCFNYLRQGLMCNADVTLEGKTDAGPGEGSEHECVDYDALLGWANEHAGMRWRNALLPSDSIL